MRGTIGLLLYVAFMVLGSILKKMAEQKARQASPPVSVDGDPYTISLEDILLESVSHGESEYSPSEADVERISQTDSEGHTTKEMDGSAHRDEKEWAEWDTEESAGDGSYVKEDTPPFQYPSWQQALIFSEIIREPRAKRPWPSR
jgi:hypothetical protein